MAARENRKSPVTVLLLGFFLVAMIAATAIWYRGKNFQIIEYRELSGPIPNPLMGWAPWATIKESNQPHTLVYADLTWRELEPREGYYDFAAFEKKQQLTRWRQEGTRVVFRFVADAPGSEMHLDIPDWLFEQINSSGDYYDNEYGKGFSPDYSNPVFIDRHGKALKALGDRYGRDGFFAFIELGSLGHWGEWHTHPGIRPLPPEDTRNLYVHQYMQAFPGTYLLMRRPFPIAQQLALGLYNDMTADLAATNTWLDWIANGGDYLPQEGGSLSPMPDGWQKAPVGGEQAPVLSDEQIYGAHLEQTLQLLRESHTTFIGPGSPYKVGNGGPLQDGIDQVLATIGYRIYLDHAQMPRWVFWGKDLDITLTFGNHGIAPIYYDWPTKIYLFDELGHTLATHQFQVDLRGMLPGQFHDVAFEIPVGGLKNDTYSIGIAIIDPLTGQPSVKFANENARRDLIQHIGSFEIKKPLNPK